MRPARAPRQTRGKVESGPGILVRDETTGKETLLYPAPSHHPRFWNLSLSPDGQRLAFFERKPGHDDRLVIVPTIGGDALLRLSKVIRLTVVSNRATSILATMCQAMFPFPTSERRSGSTAT